MHPYITHNAAQKPQEVAESCGGNFRSARSLLDSTPVLRDAIDSFSGAAQLLLIFVRHAR